MKRTWIGLGIVVPALATSGCSSMVALAPEKLTAGSTVRNVRVETSEGLQYHFDRVECEGDSLIGLYTLLRERESDRDEIYYEEVTRRNPIARSDVVQVSALRRDPGKAFLAGAGVLAAAAFIRDLASTDDKGSPGGAQTKPDPR